MLISDALGVTSSTLLRQGVYDAPLGVDLRMHVDAARLRSTRVPELSGSYKRFQQHFEKVISFIPGAPADGMLERQTKKLLEFPEIKEIGLGLAAGSNEGRGVGPVLAGRLYKTAKEIVTAGETNPAIFEIAVLFEKDFGADLFSDMTVWLLLPELQKFNKRIAKKLKLPLKTKVVHGKKITFVYSRSQKKEILLVPHSILSHIPLARDWSEIDASAAYNNSLRQAVNNEVRKLFGKKAAEAPTKPHLRQALLGENLALLKKLLTRYGKAKAPSYDFEKDPKGILTWYKRVRQETEAEPLHLKAPKTESDLHALVKSICADFKHKIEERQMGSLLFNDSGTPKNEKNAQKLFWALVDSHCVANDLDLTPEAETGRGPVDFKLSRGHQNRVLVEVKLSTNDDYMNGLTAQLPTYLKAEKVKHGILLIVKVAHNDQRLDKIAQAHAQFVEAGKNVPDLVIVDATKRPSASKLEGFLF